MTNNQKAEEYLTEVIKRISNGRYEEEELSADSIAIPDEKDLHSLEEVEATFQSMEDEEFLEMLIRVNEQIDEENQAFSDFEEEDKKNETESEEPLENTELEPERREESSDTSESEEQEEVDNRFESELEEQEEFDDTSELELEEQEEWNTSSVLEENEIEEVEEPENLILSEEFLPESDLDKTEDKTEPDIPSDSEIEPGGEEQKEPETNLDLPETKPEIAAASEWEKGGTEEKLGTKLNDEEAAESLEGSNIIDFDSDLSDGNKSQKQQVTNTTKGDEEDLMASLDSLVQEIQGETSFDTMNDQESDMDWSDETDGAYDKIALEEEKAETKKSKKKKPKKEKAEKAKKVSKKKAAKEKVPFIERVKALFFRVEVVEPLSEEEEKKQKQLKQQEKEAKKKADAEAKKKKDAEKKEAAKKKKEEAAAKKAAKPKKEKKPKPPKEPVSPEEIVHIRPMFLVFLVSVAAAIVLSTVTLSDTFGYRHAVQEARNNLENGYYEDAFKALNGLELNHSDEELYESVRILMRVEKQYRSYVNYSLMDMPNEALNSLVKAVENYDKYVDIAANYGVKDSLDEILSNVEYALEMYHLNLSTVREWNALEDTNEYTKKIMACTGSY